MHAQSVDTRLFLSLSTKSLGMRLGSMSLLHLFYRLKTDRGHDKANIGDQGIHLEETCGLTLIVHKIIP